MGYATTWHSRAAGEAPSPCRSVSEGRSDVAVRGRAEGPLVSEFRVSVVAGISTRWAARPATQADAGPTAAVVRGQETEGRALAGAGPAARRLHDGSLDPGAGGRIDPPGVRDSVSPQPRLEGPDGAGLELPEARAPRRRARRGRHRPVEAGRLAPDKKTPPDGAPISSSLMRAAFCSSPMSAGPGHREGRRRICVIATAATASRSAAGWPSRPGGDGWRSISAVAPAISPASTSARSCTICSGTCAAPSTCSGTAVRSTGVARCRRFLRATRACRSMPSRRTHPNSIRRSMSGRRPIRPSPTVRPMTWPISGGDWTPLSAVFDAPSPCSGRASMPPNCLESDEESTRALHRVMPAIS